MKEKFVFMSMVLLAIMLFSCVSTPKEVPPIYLDSIDAQLTTDAQLVYEEGDDRGNVGYWTDPGDIITWNFDIAVKGKYMVYASVSCASEFAGSTIGVTINGETLTFIMPDTYEWSDFYKVEVGSIDLAPGSYTCAVQGIELVERFYGNLKAIELKKI
ncbi:MAG: hypothetical protein JXJ04_08190 [Spirochaetales bacterium]|nr:hypothetical protein [Spirochaetales bacterium]